MPKLWLSRTLSHLNIWQIQASSNVYGRRFCLKAHQEPMATTIVDRG